MRIEPIIKLLHDSPGDWTLLKEHPNSYLEHKASKTKIHFDLSKGKEVFALTVPCYRKFAPTESRAFLPVFTSWLDAWNAKEAKALKEQRAAMDIETEGRFNQHMDDLKKY